MSMRDRTGMSAAPPLTGVELAAAVTALLASTEHDPECHPDTGCQCVIGDLERALPRCPARDGDWACLSLPHNDGQHYYGRRVGLTLTESSTPTAILDGED